MEQERAEFFSHIDASHETIEKLERYAALLTEWNDKFNLVSASTLPHIWNRHFLDSAQLATHIPENAKTLADIGSGAGFPGLVLAILGIKPRIHLVESIGKKAVFLREVNKELGLNCIIDHCHTDQMHKQTFDVVTARALARLPELLKIAKPLMHKDSKALLLKGKNAEEELTESKKGWTFVCEKIPSLSDPSASVLIIENLKSSYRNSRAGRLLNVKARSFSNNGKQPANS